MSLSAQPQIPLPYGANIHKKSRFTYTFVQKAGGSTTPATDDGSHYSQENQGPLSASQTSVTTSVQDAFVALKAEAEAPLVYAGPAQPDATIGVLDVHSATGRVSHGEKVASVILGAGFCPSDVQLIDHATAPRSNFSLVSLLFGDGEESVGQRLDAYIELSAAHVLTKTNGTLTRILADPDNRLSTINQSQGSSRADVFALLERPSFADHDGIEQVTALGERLARACGVDTSAADFTPNTLRQAFIDRINRVIENSDYIEQEQQTHIRLLEGLRERGTLVVTSAGNNADELWNLRKRGLNVPDLFDDDLCKVGPKLIVGALDDHGTVDRGDDEIAYFTSLYPGVNLMANGVKVPTIDGPATGTSYAAPQVAAEAERIRRQHPDWTVDQVQLETSLRFTATDGFNLLR